MNVPAAKKLAAEAGLELWWDPHIKLWTIYDPDDVHRPAEYIAPRPLAAINAEKFKEVYLS